MDSTAGKRVSNEDNRYDVSISHMHAESTHTHDEPPFLAVSSLVKEDEAFFSFQ